MPDHIGVEITGIKELTEMFEMLGVVGTKSVMESAWRKALKPMAEEANAIAPRGPDDDKNESKRLRGSYKIRTRLKASNMAQRGGRQHPAEMFVGSTRPHAHLVEFGHYIVRGGRVVGFSPANATMRVAFDVHSRGATRTFFTLIGGEIERVARRYRRQAERGKLSKGARIAFKVPI